MIKYSWKLPHPTPHVLTNTHSHTRPQTRSHRTTACPRMDFVFFHLPTPISPLRIIIIGSPNDSKLVPNRRGQQLTTGLRGVRSEFNQAARLIVRLHSNLVVQKNVALWYQISWSSLSIKYSRKLPHSNTHVLMIAHSHARPQKRPHKTTTHPKNRNCFLPPYDAHQVAFEKLSRRAARAP